jgi:hypothetical protein
MFNNNPFSGKLQESKFGPGSPAWRAATSGKPAASATPATPALSGPGQAALPSTSQTTGGSIVPSRSLPTTGSVILPGYGSGLGGVGSAGFARDMDRLKATVAAAEAAKAEAAKAEEDKKLAAGSAAAATELAPKTVEDKGRVIQVPAQTGVLRDRRGVRLRSPDRSTVVPFDQVLNGPVAQGRQITITRPSTPEQTGTSIVTGSTTKPETSLGARNQPEIVTSTDTGTPTKTAISTQTTPSIITSTDTDNKTRSGRPSRAESLPPMSMYGRMGGAAGVRMQGTPGAGTALNPSIGDSIVEPSAITPPSVVVNKPSTPAQPSSTTTTTTTTPPRRGSRNERIQAFLNRSGSTRRERINTFLGGGGSGSPPTPPLPPVYPTPSAEGEGKPGPFAQAASQLSANISRVRAGKTLRPEDYEAAFTKLGALGKPISNFFGGIKDKIKSFFGFGGNGSGQGRTSTGTNPPQSDHYGMVGSTPVNTSPTPSGGRQGGSSYMDPFGMTHGRPSRGQSTSSSSVSPSPAPTPSTTPSSTPSGSSFSRSAGRVVGTALNNAGTNINYLSRLAGRAVGTAGSNFVNNANYVGSKVEQGAKAVLPASRRRTLEEDITEMFNNKKNL